MTFALTPDQLEIRDAVARLCTRFDDAYWLKKDTDGGFPHDFHQAMAEAGWLGVAMPEEYGGSGLGITEAAVVMQAVAQSGAGFCGASAMHMNIFGLHPVVVFGTEEQQQRFLPPLIAGKEKACFAVTEPDVGLDTTRIKTRAVREGNGYVITGPQDLDLDRPGRREDADPRAHHRVRGVGAPVAGHDPVLHRPRPQRRRGARNPQDGPRRRSIRTCCSSTG